MDVPFPAGNDTSVLVAGGRVGVPGALIVRGRCPQMSNGRVLRRRGVSVVMRLGLASMVCLLMWWLTVLCRDGGCLCGWEEIVCARRPAFGRGKDAGVLTPVMLGTVRLDARVLLHSGCALAARGWCIRKQVSFGVAADVGTAIAQGVSAMVANATEAEDCLSISA